MTIWIKLLGFRVHTVFQPVILHGNSACDFMCIQGTNDFCLNRSIIYCTTSLIEHAKCSWLQEASAVYGIEPNLQCVRSQSIERCFEDIKHKVADVVLVDQDNRLKAERDYHLQPLIFEQSTEFHSRYVVVAVVKKNANIHSFQDLRGKRACFPNFEGAAYLSALKTYLNVTTKESSCYSRTILNNYFSSDSCIWNSRGLCADKYRGEEGALRCLNDGYDVAFVSLDVYDEFISTYIALFFLVITI